MKKVIFKCEVITPMFMSGADQRSVELRPTEFKGMMRFWWRAVKAEKDRENLRKEEAEIFGGSGEKEGKSKVSLKIKYSAFSNKIGDNIQREIQDKEGLKYLLYSTFALKAKGRRIIRKYIKPGYKFEITLSSHHNEKALRQAIASFWLAVHLGGFGTRSRRGAGCIRVLSIEDGKEYLGNLSFTIDAEDSLSLLTWLKKNTECAAKIINENKKTDFISAYPNIYFSRIKISEKSFNNSWTEALNALGKLYSDFRLHHRKHIPKHGVFGFPVVHRNLEGTVKAKFKGEIKRHASPLIFKVIKSGGKYYWLMLRLMGEFLPEGGILVFGKKTKESSCEIKKTEKPSYEIIDEFWNSVPGNEEILLVPDKLKEIKQRIIEEAKPKKIYVFGSRARGDFHEKSDLDIAIEGGSVGKLEISGNLDIVNIDKAGTSLKRRIEREGVLIYESES